MNQTGVVSTGSRRHARRNRSFTSVCYYECQIRLSESDDAVLSVRPEPFDSAHPEPVEGSSRPDLAVRAVCTVNPSSRSIRPNVSVTSRSSSTIRIVWLAERPWIRAVGSRVRFCEVDELHVKGERIPRVDAGDV